MADEKKLIEELQSKVEILTREYNGINREFDDHKQIDIELYNSIIEDDIVYLHNMNAVDELLSVARVSIENAYSVVQHMSLHDDSEYTKELADKIEWKRYSITFKSVREVQDKFGSKVPTFVPLIDPPDFESIFYDGVHASASTERLYKVIHRMSYLVKIDRLIDIAQKAIDYSIISNRRHHITSLPRLMTTCSLIHMDKDPNEYNR